MEKVKRLTFKDVKALPPEMLFKLLEQYADVADNFRELSEAYGELKWRMDGLDK